MADNVTLEATGTPGAVAATDDIAGVHYQRVKVNFGADGAATDVSAAAPLPVDVGTGATGAAKLEDVAAASGDAGVPILTVRQDTIATSSSTDGDYQHAKSSATGRLYVSATVDAALPAGTNNVGDVDVVTLPADPMGVNADAASATGSISAKLRFIAGTGIPITGTVTVASHAVTNAGTFVVQENGAALTALQLIDNLVLAEDAVHGSGDPGVMAFAVRRDADTTLVDTTGDYAPLQVNAAGSLKVAITAGAGSGGTSIADGASFTRDTTSVTLAAAAVESSAPTLTNGDAAALSMTTGGALRVAVASGGIAGIVDDAAFTPATSEVLPVGFTFDDVAPDSVNEGDIGAARMSANRNIYVQLRDAAGNERGLNIDASGNVSIGTIATSVTPGTSAAHLGKAEDAAHASGDTGVMALAVRTDTLAASSGTTGDYEAFHTDSLGALWTRDAAALVDDAAFTPGTSRVMPIGLQADETATDSVDEGDVGAPRMTLDRKTIVTAYVHAAAGGATPYQNLDVDESEDDVKTSAGRVFWVHAMNLHASSVRYLKFYNATAANVTVGSTTPVLTLAIPPNTDGFTINFGDVGTQFDTAICIAATTGFAVADSGAPGANEVIVNLGYA